MIIMSSRFFFFLLFGVVLSGFTGKKNYIKGKNYRKNYIKGKNYRKNYIKGKNYRKNYIKGKNYRKKLDVNINKKNSKVGVDPILLIGAVCGVVGVFLVFLYYYIKSCKRDSSSVRRKHTKSSEPQSGVRNQDCGNRGYQGILEVPMNLEHGKTNMLKKTKGKSNANVALNVKEKNEGSKNKQKAKVVASPKQKKTKGKSNANVALNVKEKNEGSKNKQKAKVVASPKQKKNEIPDMLKNKMDELDINLDYILNEVLDRASNMVLKNNRSNSNFDPKSDDILNNTIKDFGNNKSRNKSKKVRLLELSKIINKGMSRYDGGNSNLDPKSDDMLNNTLNDFDNNKSRNNSTDLAGRLNNVPEDDRDNSNSNTNDLKRIDYAFKYLSSNLLEITRKNLGLIEEVNKVIKSLCNDATENIKANDTTNVALHENKITNLFKRLLEFYDDDESKNNRGNSELDDRTKARIEMRMKIATEMICNDNDLSENRKSNSNHNENGNATTSNLFKSFKNNEQESDVYDFNIDEERTNIRAILNLMNGNNPSEENRDNSNVCVLSVVKEIMNPLITLINNKFARK